LSFKTDDLLNKVKFIWNCLWQNNKQGVISDYPYGIFKLFFNTSDCLIKMTPWAGLIATFLLQYLKMKYHTILFFSFRMLTNDISTRRLQYEIEAKYHTVGTFPKTNKKNCRKRQNVNERNIYDQISVWILNTTSISNLFQG
jgi:hypothetical protein